MKAISQTHTTSVVVRQLEDLLNKETAHASFGEAVQGVDHDLLGSVPKGLPYSIWQLTEHIRIAQWDMLEFSHDPDHRSPKWPEEYWPKEPAPPDAHAWKRSIDQVTADRKEFITLLHKEKNNLYTPFPYGDGQSLFHEALQIADHTAYHTAEIIVIRRLLGNWK
jgi:hypothetical protein